MNFWKAGLGRVGGSHRRGNPGKRPGECPGKSLRSDRQRGAGSAGVGGSRRINLFCRAAMTESTRHLRKTPLHALHVELGAKMVPFAGYDMPVQYPAGVLKEHLHTRAKAGLFDVSHMGQAFLSGDDPARALERVTPADLDRPQGRRAALRAAAQRPGHHQGRFHDDAADRRACALSRRQCRR